MADRYTAVVEFTYPADPESLKIVRAAGGLPFVSREQRASVRYKVVKPGEDCSDMPPESLKIYRERGEVIATPQAPSAAKKAKA